MVLKEDWKVVTMPLVDTQMMKKQTSIQDWTMKRARVDESIQEVENIPEGRKYGIQLHKQLREREQLESSTRKNRRG